MPAKPLPIVEMKAAVAALLRNQGRRDHSQAAARELGLPYATFRSRIKAAQVRGFFDGKAWTGPESDPPIEPPAEPRVPDEPLASRERQKLQDTIDGLRRELKQANRDSLDTEQVREAIIGIARMSAEPPSWLIKPQKKSGGDGPGVPVTLWSDWHWGEVVSLEETGGVNAFNLAIAHERARRLVERVIDLCFNHMTTPTYPGIVVNLGGDMISGEIHDELAESNELKTAPTILDLMGVLITALRTLADRFGNVFVPCVVGNHGRMTHKPRAKGRTHTSFEWLMYCLLEKVFRDDPRIRFHVPNEADCHYRVFGHRYMLTHGDSLGVKGGDGIIGAIGPIMRGRIKTHTSEAQIGRDFDTLLMGHWHQYLPLPGCIVNGSLKGYDEYARLYLRARSEPPVQALWFNHPERHITCHWRISLDAKKAAESGRSWVSWEAKPRAA